MDFLQQLQGFVKPEMVQQLTQQIGAKDATQTQQASNSVFSTMLAALNKNASTEEGADALNNALEKDHDGSILGNMMGLLGGGQSNNAAGGILNMLMNNNSNNFNQKTTNGSKIVNHLFGQKEEAVAQQVSKESGLDLGSSMQLMTQLAPMVMGFLGKQKQQKNMNAEELQQYLGEQKQQVQQNNPQAGNLLSFLDSDGDGSIMDDLGGMLGKFMK